MKPDATTPRPEMHHLPRLAAEFYRGLAAVQWTIPLERRAKGWLDVSFHACFRELLLHAAARESLFCPTYILMPDHLHLVWLGLRVASDQREAMRFLRKYLSRELARRSAAGGPFELQKQSHDSVLKEKDRTRGALAASCFYLLDNPRRAGLVSHPGEWPHLGAAVPGYPFMHPLEEGFWPMFWKLYQEQREPAPTHPVKPS
ncbi:MAG: hypothetical protein HY674_04545 [Chloroflexi bacterium]|nr:hypothetical protein [Chloroflexota bacterium]